MSRYRFVPANSLSMIGHGPRRRRIGRAGDIVDVEDDTYRDYVLGAFPGVDGAPCLVLVDEPSAVQIGIDADDRSVRYAHVADAIDSWADEPDEPIAATTVALDGPPVAAVDLEIPASRPLDGFTIAHWTADPPESPPSTEPEPPPTPPAPKKPRRKR